MYRTVSGDCCIAVETQQSIFVELAEFIVSQPSLEAIANYHVSPALEQCAHELLEKNCEQGLTPEERVKMEQFIVLSDIMTLVKAQARLKLKEV